MSLGFGQESFKTSCTHQPVQFFFEMIELNNFFSYVCSTSSLRSNVFHSDIYPLETNCIHFVDIFRIDNVGLFFCLMTSHLEVVVTMNNAPFLELLEEVVHDK